MGDSLFEIFGDNLSRHSMKNVARQPIANIENMGKTAGKSALSGLYKPNEPVKKMGETKKSFLSNTGKALQSTPARQVFTPRAINIGSMIYSDDNTQNEFNVEELEFTRPTNKYDNYHKDLFDFLPLPELEVWNDDSPPSTPSPVQRNHSMELDCSYQDEFFTDEFSNESIPEEDLKLPALY